MANTLNTHSSEKLVIAFDNSYVRLPERFYERLHPKPLLNPKLLRWNSLLAQELGIDIQNVSDTEVAQVFSCHKIISGAEPIAQAYAGHQFGRFVPQLGDGRALLLGEVLDRHHQRKDIHLKGSGPTSFSRRGDGRAALGPVIREYLLSEAMHALNIPTTRTLAMITTGEMVYRDTGELPGAVLVRIASSHIRVGTFEYFAARKDLEALKLLADHVIARHYPDVFKSESPYKELLEKIVEKQAQLVARWMDVGFIHGVMNTDNMTVSGETIDYGPCAFMDQYDPKTVYSYIDEKGRYAYGQQPQIAHWNLYVLGSCFLPLLNTDPALANKELEDVLLGYEEKFLFYWNQRMGFKLGITTMESVGITLVSDLLKIMHHNRWDYTLTFRYLSEIDTNSKWKSLLPNIEELNSWVNQWRLHLQHEKSAFSEIQKNMQAINPICIPRNHLVEKAINEAVIKNNFSHVDELLQVLLKPYSDFGQNEKYFLPPKPGEEISNTFCGT